MKPELQVVLPLIREWCGGGDERSFRKLYDVSKEWVYSLCYKLCGQRSAALDLSQDVWVKLWKSVCGFRGDSAFTTWLWRIAMHTWLNSRRGLKDTAMHLPLAEELSEVEKGSISVGVQLASQERSPEQLAGDSLRSAIIERALGKLSQGERAVITAHRIEGIPLVEIAETLGVSVGTVKTLHHRAMKKITEVIKSSAPYLLDEVKP